MKTSLLHLVLDVAALLLPHVSQDFGEHPFQRIVTHLTTMGAIRILNGLVTVIADVEGGTIEVARVLCRIAVTPTEFGDILLRAEYTGDDDLMQGHTLHIKAVEEGLPDILQQHSRTGYEIGNARIERIDVIIRIGCHIDQFALTGLGIGAIGYRRDAPLCRRCQLEAIGIWESLLIVGYGKNPVIGFTIGGFTTYDLGLRCSVAGGSRLNMGCGLQNVGDSHLRPYPTHAGQNDHNSQKS